MLIIKNCNMKSKKRKLVIFGFILVLLSCYIILNNMHVLSKRNLKISTLAKIPKEYVIHGDSNSTVVKKSTLIYKTRLDNSSDNRKLETKRMPVTTVDVNTDTGITFEDLLPLVKKFTLVPKFKLKHWFDSVQYIFSNKIQGAIVECGVYKGGASMIPATLIQHHYPEQSPYTLWMYDTFEGLPPPIDINDDQKAKSIWQNMPFKNINPGENSNGYIDSNGIKRWNYETLSHVQKRFEIYTHVPQKFVVGKVEDTLPFEVPPNDIALLRLDTDWYTSTKIELQILAPKLAYGGVIIVDDYIAWAGARKATDEFLMLHGDCFSKIDTSSDLAFNAIRSHKSCSFSMLKEGRIMMFYNQLLCTPAWLGDQCDIRNNASCSKKNDGCFYNQKYGVVTVPCQRWHQKQIEISAAVSPNYFNLLFSSADVNLYKYFNLHYFPKNTGNVLAIGYKSYMLLYAEAMTLIEPRIFHYLRTEQFPWFFGATTLHAVWPLDMKDKTLFDTLLLVDAVDYAHDILALFDKVFHMLKPGGIFTWHETLLDDNREYRGNRNYQIDIKSTIAKSIMLGFDTIFYGNHTSEDGGVINHKLYFIGRKKNIIQMTEIPTYTPCTNQLGGTLSLIFIINNKAAHNFSTVEFMNKQEEVKNILVVASEPLEKALLDKFDQLKKFTTFLSHHHFPIWRSEITKYGIPQPGICNIYDNGITNLQAVPNATNLLCIIPKDEIKITLVYYMRNNINVTYFEKQIWDKYTSLNIVNKVIVLEGHSGLKYNKLISDMLTEGLMLVDYDAVGLLHPNVIHNIFVTWLHNQDRLVGLEKSLLQLQNEITKETVKIMSGKALLMHRSYLDMFRFQSVLPDYTLYNGNVICEDIVVNAIARNATCAEPMTMEDPLSENNFHKFEPDDNIDSCLKFMEHYFANNVFKCTK